MPSKNSPSSAPNYSANDNGPLTAGQVKALKWAIAIMGLMIIAALLAIVGRVIYLASAKKPASSPVPAVTTIAPQHALALPNGSAVQSMSLQGNRLLVHYTAPSGQGAVVLDLATGKVISKVLIKGVRSNPQ